MISNKTVAILFLITIYIQLVASSSSGTQGSSSTGKLVFKKRQRPTFDKTKNVLKDDTSILKDVDVQGGSTEERDISKEPASSTGNTAPFINQVTKQVSLWKRLVYWINEPVAIKFARLIKERNYDEITKLGENMKDKEFLKQLCSVVKTSEQNGKLFEYLESRSLVVPFYMHGNIFVVRDDILSRRKDNSRTDYLRDALLQALKEDRHSRFVELLEVRRWITAEEDEQLKSAGNQTTFEKFVSNFLCNLAPWEGGMAFKRFLIFHGGDELRDKHHDVLDILCEKLVRNLKSQLANPKAKIFLNDLIGQPSLLTPLTFTKGFLHDATTQERPAFFDYAWSEATEVGLKSEHLGGRRLWRLMKKKRPIQFPGDFPDTDEALAAVLERFPTKQKLEDDWNKKCEKCASTLSSKLENLESTLIPIPKVLWSIIAQYANSWPDMDDEAIPAK